MPSIDLANFEAKYGQCSRALHLGCPASNNFGSIIHFVQVVIHQPKRAFGPTVKYVRRPSCVYVAAIRLERPPSSAPSPAKYSEASSGLSSFNSDSTYVNWCPLWLSSLSILRRANVKLEYNNSGNLPVVYTVKECSCRHDCFPLHAASPWHSSHVLTKCINGNGKHVFCRLCSFN